MRELSKYSKRNLNLHWVVVIIMIMTVAVSVFVCHYSGEQIQIGLEESQRILVRTIFYVIAIVLFPLTSLIRYILLRLNHTMPGDNPARNRYLVTIVVTQTMIETVAILGLVMFVLGDNYNTLYIFSGMAVLGIFLHRPKMDEYLEIVNKLMTTSD